MLYNTQDLLGVPNNQHWKYLSVQEKDSPSHQHNDEILTTKPSAFATKIKVLYSHFAF